ncbi:MAG: hypothetical protein ABFD60_12665 [Bryobacteraceae bacterium]
MHCLFCGKPLGFLKELTDGEFCCGEHRQRYKKLTKLALARLIETHAEAAAGNPELVEPITPPPARPSISSILFPAKKETREYSGIYRHFPRPKPMPLVPQAVGETITPPALAPALPAFSCSPILPSLGNAAPIWSNLEPALPAFPCLAPGFSLTPSELPSSSPSLGSLASAPLSVRLPLLHEANFSPLQPAPAEPYPALSLRDDACVQPLLEPLRAPAMPAAPSLMELPSIPLAESVPHADAPVPVSISSAILRVEPKLVPFSIWAAWRHSHLLKLETSGLPLEEVEMVSQRAFEHALPLSPVPQAALASCRPMTGVEWKSWAKTPAMSALHSVLDLACGVSEAGLQALPLAARQCIAEPLRSAEPITEAPQLVFPKLAARTVSEPSSFAAPPFAAAAGRAIASAIRAAGAPALGRTVKPAAHEAVPPIGFGAELSPLPMAGLARIGMKPVDGSVRVDARSAEPAPFAASTLRYPNLQIAHARQILCFGATQHEELQGLDAAADPIRASQAAPVAASSSLLPSLTSLFRYARVENVRRGVAMSFDGIRPKDQPRSPLAYMELAMPVRAPAIPRNSSLRIIETFEYLRPLDKPGLEPFNALLRLWRNTPAYLRLAAVSACLMILVLAANPTRVGTVVENQWAVVRTSIQNRAAVELVDRFEGGSLAGWEGTGEWANSWTFSDAGYIRPGKLAIYTPSVDMQDYHVEFLAQIDRKAVSWVYRAADQMNYYAAKLTVVKSGPAPEVALVRYAVVNGVEGPHTEVPIRLLMQNGTPYKVRVAVKGTDFSTSIEGQLVDHWRDDRLEKGGVGFYAEAGERARLYWVKLSHQDDFVGRLCSYMYPNPIMLRSGNLP